MSIKVNQSGSLVPARVMWVNSSGWKPWKYAWVRQAAGWVQFYAAQVIAAVSPTSMGCPVAVLVNHPPGHTNYTASTSATVVATETNGIGPFTYSWVTNNGFDVSSPTSASVFFLVECGFDEPPVHNTGTATVTITDTATGLTSTADCALFVSYT